MDEAAIRARIIRLIASEDLPCEADCDTWAGHGTPKPCAGCGGVIATQQVEFEVGEGRKGPEATNVRAL